LATWPGTESVERRGVIASVSFDEQVIPVGSSLALDSVTKIDPVLALRRFTADGDHRDIVGQVGTV
jgi:hypothetical protein